MGDIRSPSSESRDTKVLNIDPYALVEALLGQRIEKPASDSLNMGYDDFDMKLDSEMSSGGGAGNLRPDSPPKDIQVGAINPYALVEALIGRNIDRQNMGSERILSNVLQTDYDELFDMKHGSVLFAGLKLNEKERKAVKLSEKEMKILNERHFMTPDLSEIRKVEDLEKVGLKDLEKTPVKAARMQNGKLHVVLQAPSLGRKLSNREVSMCVNELVTPFRMQKGQWSPPNGSWRDMYDYFFQRVNERLIGNLTMFEIGERKKTLHNFDDPTQGCLGNSWLIAALFSVFWSDPLVINRATRVHQTKEEEKRLSIKFHDKGGNNNARTETVEVDYEIPINNSNNMPMYCSASDCADIWPSLYEKAFAKWVTGSSSEHPDITQLYSGDPVKAMAQINGREPHYYVTENHSANDMLGLVRANCMNFKTINPMTAWTYATGGNFRGSNIVANHAYSILGYTVLGDKQYIVLRNPWGVTEPIGLTSYPGLLERVDPNLWHPAALLDHGGLLAIEAQAFKHCFACFGVTK
ncbi:hypothetical protein B0J13DRAFT_656907 [Dactylonectria estremocensis]|uniref:Calpain catalytic domain-containing protein n=1 Tax=Dactylonectria estremocensis TaxID=1079267 RepID=A0A9P9IBP1_9HYPO|nr:hypothetical protein B0J13DRAFT_656907 [Dactylonectria estremocensis]